ncbi:hypothetical protein BASA81_015737 [Batrachochytrium salamandrivorans]|nr:hypothetical protein BASA81_015737 [Batrachochytrium salamandrivorans]
MSSSPTATAGVAAAAVGSTVSTEPSRRISRSAFRYLLLGCLCSLLALGYIELGMEQMGPLRHQHPQPPSLVSSLLEEEEEAESDSHKFTIQILGHGFLMKRDLPMIKQGYEMAFPGQISFTTSITPRSQPDLVLCIALASCLGRNDVNPPPACTQCQVNRIPNLRQVLWSKKAFCESVPEWVASLVSFPCWVLPNPQISLDTIVNHNNNTLDKWISKPHVSGAGFGITVVEGRDKLREVLRSGKSVVIQPFLDNPLLVKKRKVDLRVYVLVTSAFPVRAYVHSRGLVRFASQAYEDSTVSTSKGQSKSQFLTNTSVNKKISKMTAAELTWSFQRLWEEVGPKRAKEMRLKMDRSIALVLLSVEQKFARLAGNGTLAHRYHMLGVDVIFSSMDGDEAKVIEVNGQPSFEGSDIKNDVNGVFAHYEETKLSVARDIASIVLAPPLLLAHNHTCGQVYSEYCHELARESQANTEFRLIYPSAGVGDDTFARLVLEIGGQKRLDLHQHLIGQETALFQASCSAGACQPSLQNARDLVFADLALRG